MATLSRGGRLFAATLAARSLRRRLAFATLAACILGRRLAVAGLATLSFAGGGTTLSEALPLLLSEPEVESDPPAEPEPEAEPEVDSESEPVTGLFSEPEPSAPGLPPAGLVPSPLFVPWLDVWPVPEGEPAFWVVPLPLSFPEC